MHQSVPRERDPNAKYMYTTDQPQGVAIDEIIRRSRTRPLERSTRLQESARRSARKSVRKSVQVKGRLSQTDDSMLRKGDDSINAESQLVGDDEAEEVAEVMNVPTTVTRTSGLCTG